MCRSCSDGGRRCTDHRVLHATNLSRLRPAADDAAPECSWGEVPTPQQLYANYGADVAGATIATLRDVLTVEPVMTREFVAALPAGTRAHGLAFRVKSPQSLARKLADRVHKDRSRAASDLVTGLTDVLRYTAVAATGDDLVSSARQTIAALQRSGWTVLEVEHSFVEGSPYKGLHLLMSPHEGELTVEVQFHTEASQRVKDTTHPEYEITRDASRPLAERRKADAAMRVAWDQVPIPRDWNRSRPWGATQ